MAVVTPYIPTTITVHLGAPNQNAENVTVSFSDYIKNVASSEIYPTWEPAAIRANVLAQISFALNRVYTQFYRSRGYDFDITSSTAYDQKFIRGRNIFQSVSDIVDDVFDSYIRRRGFVEPLAAKFCNGTTVTCAGMSQWGSQELAKQGYDSIAILRNYYGDDIELVTDVPLQQPQDSFPGRNMRRGDSGEDVLIVQVMLNRISQDYPAIPKIWPTAAVFDANTERSVQKFQQIFGLTPDGIVGRATWYKMVSLYNAINRLSELVSKGQRFTAVNFRYPGVTGPGSTGQSVSALQYMLSAISEFYDVIPDVAVDGTYGPATQDAVRAFQRAAGLVQDGIAGEQTWIMVYRVFASLENRYLQSQIRFPVTAQAAAAGEQADYGLTSRMRQDPGRELGFGQSDERGEALV
ncbi:MAG: peptidoglycan-binding protein [Oscillospiraceae bacterium]|nr:peptidoglycan-binding protein [Oscillospiraceae bacterium]